MADVSESGYSFYMGFSKFLSFGNDSITKIKTKIKVRKLNSKLIGFKFKVEDSQNLK
jgi:hypothetical protein